MSWPEYVEDLKQRRAKILEMGGPERVARQHEKGRLTVRERVERLLDPNSFVEYGMLAHDPSPGFADITPADGSVTGQGTIGGRPVYLQGDDYTVFAGAVGPAAHSKRDRMHWLALKHGAPMVFLLDGGGGRIPGMQAIRGAKPRQEQKETSLRALMAGARPGTGGDGSRQEGDAGPPGGGGGGIRVAGPVHFKLLAESSGVIPLVCGNMGISFGDQPLIGAMCDFLIMPKGSAMCVAGPPVIEAATGEKADLVAIGGSQVHAHISGQADYEAENEDEALQVIRDWLSYFPSNAWEEPPVVDLGDPPDRREEELLTIVPDNPKRPYDMRRLIKLIVDKGRVLEYKKDFGKNIITCLARLGGYPIGIIANQPLVQAGALEPKCLRKAAKFANICDAFHIPLLTLADTPGGLVGAKAEAEGIIIDGVKLLHVLGRATVPKIWIQVRKAYGYALVAFNALSMDPDLLLSWPSSSVGQMGPEASVNVLFRRELQAIADPAAREQRQRQLLAHFQALANPLRSAASYGVDDLIDPRDTRPLLINALKVMWKRGKRPPQPTHGIMP